MISIPVYDMTILPGVTFYFKKELFDSRDIPALMDKEDLLFVMMKEKKSREELGPDDFYPYGVSAVIEQVDQEDNFRIYAKERVLITDIEIQNGEIMVEASIDSEKDDISDADMTIRFEKIRDDLLKYGQEVLFCIGKI